MVKKIDQLVALMRAGDWDAALSLANKFSRLGGHAKAIRQAHAAAQNPAFYRQLGLDPDALRTAGVDALRARYAAALSRSAPGG